MRKLPSSASTCSASTPVLPTALPRFLYCPTYVLRTVQHLCPPLHAQGSIFPASIVAVYATYLCFSALSSEPKDYACNGLGQRITAASGVRGGSGGGGGGGSRSLRFNGCCGMMNGGWGRGVWQKASVLRHGAWGLP